MPIKIKGEEYFFVEDLERILQLTPTTIRLYFKIKKLIGRKLGQKWMISNSRLKDFLDGVDVWVPRGRKS